MKLLTLTQTLLLIFLLNCLPEFVHGEHQTSRESGFVALSVADHDGMVDWYIKVLGYQLISRGENAERTGSLLRRGDDLLEIASFSNSEHDKREAHLVHGIMKFGYVVSDINVRFDTLKDQAEVFFPVVSASGGYQTFAIRDPEGNIIQFFQAP